MWNLARLVIRAALLIILMPSIYSACSKSEKVPNRNNEFRVRKLAAAETTTVGDQSLEDWDSSFVVMKIRSQEAHYLQWGNIRNVHPGALNGKYIEISVYMARDSFFWYIAAEIVDDKTINVPFSSPYPYSGDCLEIFFAGDSLRSLFPIENFVDSLEFPHQAAFFQLQLPANLLDDSSDYLSDDRTDTTFEKKAIREGFKVSIWRHDPKWYAEVRIPFSAFDNGVRARINRQDQLSMNLTYLNYDMRLAERTPEDNWGYKPDNVFCLDSTENNVKRPRLMRSVVFE